MKENVSVTERMHHVLMPNTVAVGIYMLVGIPANIIVIFVFVTRMKDTMHRRYFIPYLATIDLIGCFYNGLNTMPPSYILKSHYRAWCKIQAYVGSMLVFYSFLLLFCISIQRYLTICSKKANSFDKRRKCLLCTLLVLSISLAAPRVIFLDTTVLVVPSTNETVPVCGFSPVYHNSAEQSAYTYLLLVILCTAVSIMSVLYVMIIKKVIASSKNMKTYGGNRNMYIDNSSKSETIQMSTGGVKGNIDASQQTTEDQTAYEAKGNRQNKGKAASQKNYQRRLCFLFLLISASAIVTYLPRVVVELMWGNDPLLFVIASPAERTLYLLMSSLYISQSAINPFIYCAFDKMFRRNLKHLLTGRH